MSKNEIPYGYCHCGCGQKTNIAKKTRTEDGIVKGQPVLYIVGHSTITPIAERFWKRVTPGPFTECWLWQGVKRNGYGMLSADRTGKGIGAHRVSWMIHFGEIPDGLFVCHRCDNPSCVNPAHLFLGTLRDNHADMMAKGRDGHGAAKGISNPSAKLTESQVKEIRAMAAQGMTQVEIGQRFGITQAHVSDIVLRKVWTHV